MDRRVEHAQHLYWRIVQLRAQHPEGGVRFLLRTMAFLHESRARDMLSQGNVDGWIDLFAAATAWGNAGMVAAAQWLLGFARERARSIGEGRKNIESEIDETEDWLRACAVDERSVLRALTLDRHGAGRAALLASLRHIRSIWRTAILADAASMAVFALYATIPFRDLDGVAVYDQGAPQVDGFIDQAATIRPRLQMLGDDRHVVVIHDSSDDEAARVVGELEQSISPRVRARKKAA